MAELKAERKRLSLRRAFLEAEIKQEFKELKKSFEPMKLLAKGAEDTLGDSENHLLGNSVGSVVKFLAKTSLRRSGYISRLVVPYLARNAASSFVENNKGKILGWLEILASRLYHKKAAKD